MTTPNMNLDLPVVDVTPEDVWAEMLIEALEAIDEHDHSSGKGVKITPSGLNINSDLTFNSHRAKDLAAVVLESQSSDASSAYSVYVKNNELFYKDNSGNAVQLTNSGSIAGASGTISGLVSPASASFNSTGNVFSFSYDSGKTANVAVGNVKLYPYNGSTSYSNNVQLKAPTSLSATYTWTLPDSQAPGDRIVSIDNTGQLQYLTVSGTTNQISVTQNATGVTISTPQNIHTGASPTFAGMNIVGNYAGTGTISGSSLIVTGQVSAGSFRSTGDGFGIKMWSQSGVLSGGSSTTISPTGASTIYGFVGRTTRAGSSTAWYPIESTLDDSIDGQTIRGDVSSSTGVKITNVSGSGNSYNILIYYS